MLFDVLIGIGATIAFLIGILVFVNFIFLFAFLTEVDDKRYIRKMKQKYGIIWNPIKAGFLFHEEKFGLINRFSIGDILIYSGPSFLCQFLLRKNPRDRTKSRAERRYEKLQKKYLGEREEAIRNQRLIIYDPGYPTSYRTTNYIRIRNSENPDNADFDTRIRRML